MDLNIQKNQDIENAAEMSAISHHIEVKTGTPSTHIKNPPYHLKTCFEFEPLAQHDDAVLEKSLLREVKKLSNQENQINRVVYDYLEPSPY